ncbi:MAG: two-component regulator propeller domain-containing protein [Bacteroidales bacterium]|nr:two-component regulator propeller domain-containing protein [Bacteroidales bacterium]MDY6000888.1 two-component regulator propeller domain-containing protein [Candidatus Cryptobacteroides sp.]
MKRICVILFLLFTMLAWASPVRGHDEYSFTSISLGEGLSHPNVLSLLSDSRGSMWVGTVSGLTRFYHSDVTVYKYQENDASALPDSRIEFLAEDSSGCVWVLTDGGLARYIPQTDSFETVIEEPVWGAVTCENCVIVSGNGCLYICPSGGAAPPEKVTLFDVDDARYRIPYLDILPDGRILAGTSSGGLFICDMNTWSVTPFSVTARPQLMALHVSNDGFVYAAFYGDGFYRYDLSGNEIEHFTTKNSGLSNDYVLDFADYDGMLWVCTDGGGISIFSPSDGSFRTLRRLLRNAWEIPSNSVTVLYEDDFGFLWAGTVKKGFFQIRKKFIQTLNGRDFGLQDDAVSSIYRDSDGVMWIGTDGGGLHKMDPSADFCTPCPSTAGTKVLSIAALDDNTLLLSLYTRGFFTYDKRTGSISPFVAVNEEVNAEMCFNGYLPIIAQVSPDKIYFMSVSPWAFDISGRKFYPMPSDPAAGPMDCLRLAVSGNKFNLFYREKAVLFTTPDSDSLRTLFSIGSHGVITALAYDGNNTIWVGTDVGLGRYDLETSEYKPVHTGLFDSVAALALGDDGQLWVCADNKLFSLEDNLRFASWDLMDGFEPNNIKMNYQYGEDPGYIFFGGSAGLVRIDRRARVLPEQDPLVFPIRLYVNGIPEEFPAAGEPFKVKHKYNSVSVAFTARYRDMFQGGLFRIFIGDGHRTVSEETRESRIALPLLSEGTYSVSVSCLRKDGTFSAPAEILLLRVLPPWYRTVMSRIVMLIILLAAVGIAIRIIRRSQNRQAKNDVAQLLTGLLNASNKDEVIDNENVPQGSEAVPSPFMEKFEKVVNENISNPKLDVQFICDEMMMSRTKLYDKVKQETGKGVNDCINRLRIERSVELLLNTDLSINEIAYNVGFTYPRYFSTLFKNVNGLTPSRFKQENKK